MGVEGFIGETSGDDCWFETKIVMKVGELLRLRVDNERAVRANIEHFAKGFVFTMGWRDIERCVGVCGTLHFDLKCWY